MRPLDTMYLACVENGPELTRLDVVLGIVSRVEEPSSDERTQTGWPAAVRHPVEKSLGFERFHAGDAQAMQPRREVIQIVNAERHVDELELLQLREGRESRQLPGRVARRSERLGEAKAAQIVRQGT